jgi:hypothetical protein
MRPKEKESDDYNKSLYVLSIFLVRTKDYI